MVDMHKNSHLDEQLYLKHNFSNSFSNVLGSSTAFEHISLPLTSEVFNSVLHKAIHRADRYISVVKCVRVCMVQIMSFLERE